VGIEPTTFGIFWAGISKVVGSIPTVVRHIFQACPVRIYTQSNITQAFCILLTFSLVARETMLFTDTHYLHSCTGLFQQNAHLTRVLLKDA
jgi:hypothetical protein